MRKEIIYTALFDSIVNEYTVTWSIDDRQEEETYEYGDIPTHEDPKKPGSHFIRWDKEITEVTGIITYTALFEIHTWSEWRVSKEPVANTSGEKERACIRCVEKETEIIPVTTMSVDNVTLSIGEEYTLTASVLPEGTHIEEYVWTSSNEEVVTVDQN